MSEIVPYKGGKSHGPKLRDYKAKVVGLEFSPGRSTRVSLANHETGSGACLGCEDTPCMTKRGSELELAGALASFPGDPSLAVCPTNAIDLSDDSNSISVSAQRCIGCGLCIVRCPYGAITLTPEGFASIAMADPDNLTTKKVLQLTHPHPKRIGKIGVLSGLTALKLVEAVSKLPDSDRSVFIRNLLHEVGIAARVRRRGDMNVRMDAVGFTKSGRPFVAEIELVGGELEVPRALLEDVAVLHARYGFQVNAIDVLSIISWFPNVRSEYYQVIRDINKILGINCRTLTVGALLALVWAGKTIDTLGGSVFRVEEGGIDLAKALDIPGQSEPYPGAFRPAK